MFASAVSCQDTCMCAALRSAVCCTVLLCQGIVLLSGSDYVSDLFRQFSARTAKINAPRHLLQGKLQFSAAATGASPGETFLLEIQRNQFFK